jgi:hypothetical protein
MHRSGLPSSRLSSAGVADPIINQHHGRLVEALIEREDGIGVRGKIHGDQPGKIGAKPESIVRCTNRFWWSMPNSMCRDAS